MSPAKQSAVYPGTGHTETFAAATAKHSEPQSDAGSAEPAGSVSAEKEEISQAAAQTTRAAAEATGSAESTKVVFTTAK